ncbi:hypothetical protein BIW11_13862, partial [Tropilaelaps mercedesae]
MKVPLLLGFLFFGLTAVAKATLESDIKAEIDKLLHKENKKKEKDEDNNDDDGEYEGPAFIYGGVYGGGGDGYGSPIKYGGGKGVYGGGGADGVGDYGGGGSSGGYGGAMMSLPAYGGSYGYAMANPHGTAGGFSMGRNGKGKKKLQKVCPEVFMGAKYTAAQKPSEAAATVEPLGEAVTGPREGALMAVEVVSTKSRLK